MNNPLFPPMSVSQYEKETQNIGVHIKNFLIVDGLVRTGGMTVVNGNDDPVQSEEVEALASNITANADGLLGSVKERLAEVSVSLAVASGELDGVVGTIQSPNPLTASVAALVAASKELDIFENESQASSRKVDLVNIKAALVGHKSKLEDVVSMLKSLKTSLARKRFTGLPSGQDGQLQKAVNVVVKRSVDKAGQSNHCRLPPSIYLA